MVIEFEAEGDVKELVKRIRRELLENGVREVSIRRLNETQMQYVEDRVWQAEDMLLHGTERVPDEQGEILRVKIVAPKFPFEPD